jgi:hypothetical protein
MGESCTCIIHIYPRLVEIHSVVLSDISFFNESHFLSSPHKIDGYLLPIPTPKTLMNLSQKTFIFISNASKLNFMLEAFHTTAK